MYRFALGMLHTAYSKLEPQVEWSDVLPSFATSECNGGSECRVDINFKDSTALRLHPGAPSSCVQLVNPDGTWLGASAVSAQNTTVKATFSVRLLEAGASVRYGAGSQPNQSCILYNSRSGVGTAAFTIQVKRTSTRARGALSDIASGGKNDLSNTTTILPPMGFNT